MDVFPVQDNVRQHASSGAALQFIDFEYSCPMQRGFDWVCQHQASIHELRFMLRYQPWKLQTTIVILQGNHFNEYAGFECDYGRYPDAQRASHFLRHYLSEAEGCEPVRVPDMPNMHMQTRHCCGIPACCS
jgi:hypothetical protein